MKEFNSHVVLYNMNTLQIEKEFDIDWNKELKDEIDFFFSNKRQYFINRKGLEIIKDLDLVVSDKKVFIFYIVSLLYPEYKLIDYQGFGGVSLGHPDFVLEKGDERIYIELKMNYDTLRLSQLDWFARNKDKNNKLLSININLKYIEDGILIKPIYNTDGDLISL
jgi:hypothetical protein